jgi:hypothetical protein
MKRLLLLLTTIPLAGFAPSSSADPRLMGILNVEDVNRAIMQSPPPRRFEVVFSEGQRDDGVEVVKIDSTNRRVTARFSTNSQPRVLALDNASSSTNHGPGIMFEGVSLQTVLNFFAEFSGRVILQHPSLQDTKFSLASSVTNRDEAAQVLKNALAEKQIVVVPDGSKFLLVAPKEMISTLNPRSAAIATTNSNPAKSELLPPGSINFQSAPLGTVLMIYAEFLGGKLDRTGPALRNGKVIFKMQTALTKEECLYAFETLIGWHGIKLVSTEARLFKAVPID